MRFSSLSLLTPLLFSSLLISISSLPLPSSPPLLSLFLWGLLSNLTVTSVPSLLIFGDEMRDVKRGGGQEYYERIVDQMGGDKNKMRQDRRGTDKTERDGMRERWRQEDKMWSKWNTWGGWTGDEKGGEVGRGKEKIEGGTRIDERTEDESRRGGD